MFVLESIRDYVRPPRTKQSWPEQRARAVLAKVVEAASAPAPSYLSEFSYIPQIPQPRARYQARKWLIGTGVALCAVTVVVYQVGGWRLMTRRFQLWWKRCKESWFSWILNKTINNPCVRPHHLRSMFRDMDLPHVSEHNPGHTHPQSAAWRSSAATVARILASSVGLQPFMLQASTTDVKSGLAHSRSYHWSKDTMVAAQDAQPSDRHLLTVVDVDYYLDLPELLLSTSQPVLLYTFQPDAVSCDHGEFIFYFDEQDRVHYKVSGGAEYVHKVWKYSVDVFTVSDGWTTKNFLVERRRANAHHEYVLLVPVGTWHGLWAYFAEMLTSNVLTTYGVNHGEFNLLDVHVGSEVMRSVGRVSQYNSAKVSISVFEAIESVARNSTLQIAQATVLSWVQDPDQKDPTIKRLDKRMAAALVDYLRLKNRPLVPVTVYPAISAIRNFQPVSCLSLLDSEPRANMVSFMSPLVPAAFVPVKGLNSELAAIKGRILLPQLDAAKLAGNKISKNMLDLMDEFIPMLFPGASGYQTLHPVSVEEVYERQARPAQRDKLERADTAEPKRVMETMLKVEAYQKATDPRIITLPNTVDKRDYAAFIYALHDVLLKQPWYGPGKTPRELSEQVVVICNGELWVLTVDFAKMDGHKRLIARTLERKILMYRFSVVYHHRLLDLHGSTHNVRAHTPHGASYDMECAQGSGVSDTTTFNTIPNKFGDYVARRRAGWTPREAFDCPGSFTGDDSLVRGMLTDTKGVSEIVLANASLGQRAEVDLHMAGSSTVNYLARVFGADVWSGDTSSCCDLARTLSKLHVTPNLAGFPALEKLRQKLSSLALTDASTPIISKLVQTAVRVGMQFDVKPDLRVASWWSSYSFDENWPNSQLEDEADFVAKSLPTACVDRLYGYLDNCKKPEDLLSMPYVVEFDAVPAKSSSASIVVVDDLVLPAVCPPGFRLNVDPERNPSSPEFVPVTPSAPPVAEPVGGYCYDFIQKKCKGKCAKTHLADCKDYVFDVCKRKVCRFPHTVPPFKK